MRESPRIRRLRTDRKALEKLRSESSILDFRAIGNPAEEYLIRFLGRGLWRPEGTQQVLVRERHEVRIKLGVAYPRMMPELTWQTPIFHPNISAGGIVCLGGYGTYWVPSLNLDELCIMLWDMVRYANYDVNSPYNREAALWAKSQTQFHLPIDARPLRDRLAGGLSLAPPRYAGSHPGPIDAEVVFLDDSATATGVEVVEAEVVEGEDPDILFIE